MGLMNPMHTHFVESFCPKTISTNIMNDSLDDLSGISFFFFQGICLEATCFTPTLPGTLEILCQTIFSPKNSWYFFPIHLNTHMKSFQQSLTPHLKLFQQEFWDLKIISKKWLPMSCTTSQKIAQGTWNHFKKMEMISGGLVLLSCS